LHRFAPPTAPHGRSNCTGKGWDSRLWAFYHKGIPIAADSGIDSSIRVHARAHIIVLYSINLQVCVNLSKNEMAGRAEQRMLNAAKLASCNPFCLSGRVCSQADVLPVSRPPKTTQQANSHANATLHRFPSKLLHSGNTHQSPCSLLTPHTSHLTPHQVPSPHPPSSESNPHPHGEQDEKASVRPSLHN
jgi:hypothetical protein